MSTNSQNGSTSPNGHQDGHHDGHHDGHQEGSKTIWTDTFRPIETSALEGVTSADVAIVGAGIAGLSVAYHCAREGLNVAVLDDGRIGGGETGRTTAHLSNALDDRFYEIERLHGWEGLQLAAESQTRAIDQIEQNVHDAAIDCDFERVDGFLFLPPGEMIELLDKDLLTAMRAGIPGVGRVSRAPVDGWESGPCNRFPRQAQFHPLKYLAGLAQAVERKSGRIYCGSHVANWRIGDSVMLETAAGGRVTSRYVVFATNAPINDRVVIHTKQAPYLTHVVGIEVPAGRITPSLLWDLASPYHYVRIVPGAPGASHDVLLVGGEDYKTAQGRPGDPGDRYMRLERWARMRFGLLQDVVYRWSGQVMEPVDALPYIGRNPLDSKNVFVVTGDSGQGIIHGALAGSLICDLILQRSNPFEKLYDPSRKALGAPLDYARENLNVAAQFVDHLTGGDVASSDEIPPGGGAILRSGIAKHAVHRDLSGKLHTMSAICPHLGCVVGWNDSEKTWDCPCHGSRFQATGAVINGPANVPLAPVEVHEKAKEAT